MQPELVPIPAAGGGAIPTHFGKPRGSGPAVIVIGSIFGLDDEMRDMVDAYAAAGYNAVAPDLFWRTRPGPLKHDDPDQRALALDRYERFDVESGLADIESILEYLRKQPGWTGRYGVAGYCFGGRYALLAAARLGAAAAVSFHGSLMGRHLDEVDRVRCPVSFHFGDNDQSVPLTEIQAIANAFASHENASVCIYPGVGHGFTSPSRKAYDPDVTARSWRDAMATLQTLRDPVTA
jgi:carboxymethylenebutenolidase